jgi:hypothetical protein
MKLIKENNGAARCDGCIFGRCIVVVDTNKRGEEVSRRELCECHVARPTRSGFPTVRRDDFCSCHVSAKTTERTFAGLLGGEARVML